MAEPMAVFPKKACGLANRIAFGWSVRIGAVLRPVRVVRISRSFGLCEFIFPPVGQRIVVGDGRTSKRDADGAFGGTGVSLTV